MACSGGADSLALALALRSIQGVGPVGAITVDHGLQAGSADRAAATARLLRDIGYPEVAVLPVSVDGPGGPEAAARRARYSALEAHARDRAGRLAPVLLGHTADDQAETVLLGLARGSGPRSISGMRAWRAPWGRPLLTVRRADTEALCASAGLTPWLDPHNREARFTRVRLRHEVLPLLDEVLGGGVVAALGRTAALIRADLDALDRLAAAAFDAAIRPDGSLQTHGLAGQPTAIRTRVLRSWALSRGAGPLTHDHLGRMDRVLIAPRTRERVRLPGDLDVGRPAGSQDRLSIERRSDEPPPVRGAPPHAW